MKREEAKNHLAEWLDKKMWRCFGTIDREAISIAVEALSPRRREDATEEDYAYCDDCEAVEMCMWYPYRECQFKVSRPSGKWIAQKHKGEYVEFDVYVCSECGIVGGIQANEWNYCPNCGCRMNKGDEE